MSDIYSKIYENRKGQLQTDIKPVIGDIKVEIEKVRSSTPKKERSASIEPKKKIAYKCDVDELKIKLDNIQENFKTLEIKFKNIVDETKKELEQQIEKQKNIFESVKSENLKNAVNDAVKSFNENIKNIANEMVNHLDSITELKTRVQDIESVM